MKMIKPTENIDAGLLPCYRIGVVVAEGLKIRFKKFVMVIAEDYIENDL